MFQNYRNQTRHNLDSARKLNASRNYSIKNNICRHWADYLAKLMKLEAEQTVRREVPKGWTTCWDFQLTESWVT
jgi:hypothetical protein